MSRPADHSIVTDRSALYLRLVIVRLFLSLLILAALALAPLGISGGSPAMAMSDHSMASDAHPCDGKSDPGDGQSPDDCCVMACAAIPAMGEELSFNAGASGHTGPRPLARDPRGLAPEAEPPPPRRS